MKMPIKLKGELCKAGLFKQKMRVIKISIANVIFLTVDQIKIIGIICYVRSSGIWIVQFFT